MLIDEALEVPRPSYIDRKLWQRLQTLRYRCHRFEFSPQASKLAGALAIEDGDLVFRNRQFAIPPFTTTYIEVDSRKFLEGMPAARLAAAPETSDLRNAYLIDERDVFIFASGPGSDGEFSPFGYRMVPPGQDAGEDIPEIVFTDASYKPLPGEDGSQPRDMLRLSILLGTAVDAALLSGEDYKPMLSEVSLQWRANKFPDGEAYFKLLRYNAGDVRNLWALLLWLNQPQKVRYEDRPAGRRWFHGKQIAYKRSTVVNIELGKVRTIRKIFESLIPRESPINHPVRGEFHHRGGTPGCSHQWPLLPDERGHWVCQSCERKRWWVREHRRGDATKGFIESRHVVSTPKLGAP